MMVAMRPPRHRERHFAGSDAVRDVILGMSDGLTTPFALAAGLAGAAPSSLLVVIGGLAEIARSWRADIAARDVHIRRRAAARIRRRH